MFDNHRAPSIPPRNAPPHRATRDLAQSCALAGLIGLPLTLAAAVGSASLPVALMIGLGQILALIAAITLGRGAPAAPLADSAQSRIAHG